MPLYRIYECCGVRRAVHGDTVPLCGTCRGPMRWKQTREWNEGAHMPQFGRAPAIDFNQTRERVVPIGEHGIRVDSLADIRRIERESEKRARDGVGEQYVFRKYAQDHSNLYEHTLGKDPSVQPSKDWLRTHQIGALREDDAHATATLGPSTIEEKTSALPEGF